MSTQFNIDQTEIAKFSYGSLTRRVWASLNNTSLVLPPNQWQFGYDPLFIPEVDGNGKLVTNIQQVVPGVWRVSMRIFLDNAKAQGLQSIPKVVICRYWRHEPT